MIVPHHDGRDARQGYTGIQRWFRRRPGLASRRQPALLVQAQIVRLDLPFQRLANLEGQLPIARHRNPFPQRLDVFPDRIEIDLVSAHQHQMEALQPPVVDALLVPQLLLVQQLGFARARLRAQFAIMAVEQVFPHGIRGPDDLAHG
jgi:hypothetical protein